MFTTTEEIRKRYASSSEDAIWVDNLKGFLGRWYSENSRGEGKMFDNHEDALNWKVAGNVYNN